MPALPLNDPGLQRLGRRFAGEHANLVDRILAIHDFVARQLKYDRDGRWDAAATVLERKSGSC
jgi:hypothetical protein